MSILNALISLRMSQELPLTCSHCINDEENRTTNALFEKMRESSVKITAMRDDLQGISLPKTYPSGFVVS